MPTADLPDEHWVKQARILFEQGGELEIDDEAPISRNDSGDDGAYVQAWVWVPNPTN